MYEVFKQYRLINKVVISLKKDKRGKKYGFVRFGKVREERVLAIELIPESS